LSKQQSKASRLPRRTLTASQFSNLLLVLDINSISAIRHTTYNNTSPHYPRPPLSPLPTMYRRRNGSLSFSWGRLVTNAIPNFASNSALYTELTPQRRDLIYSYQLSTSSPLTLGPNIFYVAGCTDSERRSAQIHRALTKNGVLSETGMVNTTAIGPKFIHQLAFIDQMSQKNLINVLFFWEEEVQRLNKLSAEEMELTGLIDEAEKAQSQPEPGEPEMHTMNTQSLDQMKFARERVRMKQRQRPTQRRGDLEADQDTTVEDAFRARGEAPGYASAVQAPAAGLGQELPPSYHPGQQSGRHWSVA
jgi:hypothetical protein